MIEQLKTEIRDLENTVQNKKEELKKLMEAALFEKNKLIAMAEMHDQFSGITDVELIDDTEIAVKEFEDKYNSNFYNYKLYIFRISELAQLKEDFKHLSSLLAVGYYGQDDLYEWMDENKSKRINEEK